MATEWNSYSFVCCVFAVIHSGSYPKLLSELMDAFRWQECQATCRNWKGTVTFRSPGSGIDRSAGTISSNADGGSPELYQVQSGCSSNGAMSDKIELDKIYTSGSGAIARRSHRPDVAACWKCKHSTTVAVNRCQTKRGFQAVI